MMNLLIQSMKTYLPQTFKCAEYEIQSMKTYLPQTFKCADVPELENGRLIRSIRMKFSDILMLYERSM